MIAGIGKPLGGKAYGHIPHLPGSRMGPGDHHCHAGQAEICTVKKRDRHDSITVTCKLDGSCVAVSRMNGVILPLVRAGHLASTSKYEQHQLFFQWAMEQQSRFLALLEDGERVVGEWLAQAHGTRYSYLREPFATFDLFREGKRIPFEEMRQRVNACDFDVPDQILIPGNDYQFDGPLSVEKAMAFIGAGLHGEHLEDPAEGAVWRVERRGEFDFMAKYVRPDKVDGKYLPEVSGQPAIWNWRPSHA